MVEGSFLQGLPSERIGLDTNLFITSTYPKIEWIPVSMGLADRAAELHACYRLSTPDAIQLATAIGHKATRFYGNDRSLRRVKEIECLLVDDLT